MTQQVFGAQATAVELYVAFNGAAPSNPILTNYVSIIGTTNGSNLAQLIGNSFSSVSDATLSALVLANLGVTATSTNADAFASISTVLPQVFAAFPSARGQIVLNLVNILSTLEGNAAYGTAAAAFNNTIANAFVYASNTANTTPGSLTSAPIAVTFTLTSGADTGAAFTGGAGDDTFVGQIAGDMGTGTSLNAGDVLSGGAGTDTLSVTVAGTATAAVTSIATTTSGIEKVLVSNFETSTFNTEFNGALWTGVLTVGLSSSSATGDTTFTNLKNIVGAEMTSGAGDLSVSYLSSVVSGTADSQALALNGVTAGTFTADAGIETVAITSSGTASTLTALSASGASKLTIAASAALTISGSLDTNIKTIDASASTAGVSLVLGTADLTVTGGSGNDTIRIAGSTVDANDTINAGDGTDSLQLTDAVATAAAGAKLAGFENLYIYENVTGAGTGAAAESLTVTQDVSLISGITKVGVTKMTYTDDNDTNADTGALTAAFTNMSADQVGVISGITSAGDADDNGAMTATVSFDLLADTTADSGTITLGTATAAATVAGANNAITLNVTADDYETLSLVNQGGAQTIATLTAADATTLNITASKALTITTLSGAAVKTIDASASTANVIVGATTVASTITGGAGNDTFTGSGLADSISGGAGNDSLVGGSGNDTIMGGVGNDTITGGAGNDKVYGEDGNDTFVDVAASTEYVDGGAGNDTFNVVAVANLTSADTIIGGDGTDTLVFADIGNVDLTADITALTNVTGVEVVAVSGMDGGDTLTVNDGVVSAAGGALTLKFVTGVTGANTVSAAGVLATSSMVTFTDLAGLGTTYSIGNGKDNASMGDGADTVVVSNSAYLSANDTLAGGTGSDTLSFTNDTAATNTITAAQLTNVTGFETFSINHATDTNLVKYVFTLDDTIVGNQVAVGATFTITRDAAEDGTLKVDGSAVSASYTLSLSGEDGADTLIGGAGNDTIVGANGADSLTGGAGNDTFQWAVAATGQDTITDFSFGTSTTTVDVLKFTGGTWQSGANVATASGVGTLANAQVIVLDTAAYQDLTAMNTVVTTGGAFAQTGTAASIILWQDTLGKVHVTYDSNGATTGGQTDLAILSGLTITGVASTINYADFVLA